MDGRLLQCPGDTIKPQAEADELMYRYLAILEVCECVQMPCPLPVFDLSGKIFPQKKKTEGKEG